VGAHIAAERMLFGPLSYITWIGVVALGIVGPMISGFAFAKYRYSGYALLVVSVLVIVGALLLRYTVLASSAFEPMGLL
jgi:formate-dependent nitrite reductase membrane component NrfD